MPPCYPWPSMEYSSCFPARVLSAGQRSALPGDRTDLQRVAPAACQQRGSHGHQPRLGGPLSHEQQPLRRPGQSLIGSLTRALVVLSLPPALTNPAPVRLLTPSVIEPNGVFRTQTTECETMKGAPSRPLLLKSSCHAVKWDHSEGHLMLDRVARSSVSHLVQARRGGHLHDGDQKATRCGGSPQHVTHSGQESGLITKHRDALKTDHIAPS